MSYNQPPAMYPYSQFFLEQINPTNNFIFVGSMFIIPIGQYPGYPEPTNYHDFGVSIPTGKMGLYQESLVLTPPPSYPRQEIVWN